MNRPVLKLKLGDGADKSAPVTKRKNRVLVVDKANNPVSVTRRKDRVVATDRPDKPAPVRPVSTARQTFLARRDAGRALQDEMRTRWPVVFHKSKPLPLKLGIHRDIADALGISRNRPALNVAMNWHCTSAEYLKALSCADAQRHDLDGVVVEPVSEDNRALALEMLRQAEKRKANRRKKRGRGHPQQAHDPKEKGKS